MSTELIRITNQEQATAIIRKVCSIDEVAALKPETYLANPECSSLRKIVIDMNGEKKILRIVITGIIENFLQRFEKGSKWTTDMVIELADIFITDYAHYKLEDIQLFFYRAKRGYFGKTFNRLDYEIIFQWLDRYDAERTEIWHKVLHNRRVAEIAEEQKQLPPGSEVSSEEAQKIINDTIHKLQVKSIQRTEEMYPGGQEPEFMKQMREAENAYQRALTEYVERKMQGETDSARNIFYRHEFVVSNNKDRFIENYFFEHFGKSIQMQTHKSKV